MGLKDKMDFKKNEGKFADEKYRPVKAALTSSSEGQVVAGYVRSKEVLLDVLPHVGYMCGVTQERPICLLVTKVKETCPMLLRVGFEVKEIIDLMRGRFWPFFKFVQDIECGQHSISIRSNLEGGDTKIVGRPLIKRM